MGKTLQRRTSWIAGIAVAAFLVAAAPVWRTAGAIIGPENEPNVTPIESLETLNSPVGADVQAVRIDHRGGSVRVIPHDQADVRVEFRRTLTPSLTRNSDFTTNEAQQEYLQLAKALIVAESGSCTIETSMPDRRPGARLSVAMDVFVPAAASVAVRNARGDIEVSDLYAPIEVEALEGDIRVDGAHAAVKALSSSGSIDIAMAADAPHDSVFCKTLDGRIHLALPEAHAFDLTVDALGSHFTSDFPITVAGPIDGSRFSAQVHGGGAPIYIDTLAGDIAITQR